MIDATDLQILTILQSNARTSNADIARQVGMAPSAILERIRKLEQRGIIQGYEARIDPRALGLGMLAYVAVRTDERVGDECAGERLARIPEVQEVHHVAGEDCYLLKVRVKDAKALGRLLQDQIKAVEPVRSTRTTVVLDTLRETSLLPLEEEEPAHD
ncbi:MAG: Lrp/AsnC family transcriptional regulator, leucine-responsive regulatory protein [Acidobacteriota bacterium]|jgi:Lrp/AsnC family leucine-responsive transcriptional regulator|nr:Lrp/AsnC family transcriptional regulator, leucine-responsive regulatory protein [Acidobacteriota bacterium]